MEVHSAEVVSSKIFLTLDFFTYNTMFVHLLQVRAGSVPMSKDNCRMATGMEITDSETGPASVNLTESEKARMAQVCLYIYSSSYFLLFEMQMLLKIRMGMYGFSSFN